MLPRIDFRNACAVTEFAAGSGIPAPDVPRDSVLIALAEACFSDSDIEADARADEECPCFSA